MARKRLYSYNRVVAVCKHAECLDGMLLTNKELKKIRERNYHFLDGTKLEKVKVYNTDIYYCFGRFANEYRLVEA